MIYPLLPVFLAGVLGAGALSLGIIEGVAESTASVLKVVSGRWSDRVRRRKPLVLAGYGLSGAVRPMIGLAAAWPFVLAMRFADRVGKGLRTSPRDALIADVTNPVNRGRAYGLHRAMDHAGAVAGPLAAAGLMASGMSMRGVFLASALPAVIVVAVIILGIREEHPSIHPPAPPTSPGAWAELGPEYRRFLGAVLLFTLGNSTDAFLLLRLAGSGVGAGAIAILWSLHHVVKMVSTFAGGRMADRTGSRPMVLAGWSFYALVYLLFAMAESRAALVSIFLAYGLYYGLTEPAEKRWVASLVPNGLRGTAFGYYHGAVGLAALPASLMFGFVWQIFGVSAAFILGAALAGAAALLVSRIIEKT
ncbi:MAG: MFS transporter [Proteobacteria bacterium]|nr:MFS transporter [Pseudomonadota bacterium]